MKAIKTLLAVSALVTVAGAANATVWDVNMSGSVFFAAANGPLNFIGFTGTYDDATNAGSWSGTTTIPAFATTMHYNQTFTMDETTGVGVLNAFDIPTCTDNTGSGCAGLSGPLSGDYYNTIGSTDTAHQTPLAFTPADGWTGQWTLQVYKAVVVGGKPTFQYLPLAMDVTLHAQAAPTVPVPAAAWLFGSGLLGLAGTARRRRSV